MFKSCCLFYTHIAILLVSSGSMSAVEERWELGYTNFNLHHLICKTNAMQSHDSTIRTHKFIYLTSPNVYHSHIYIHFFHNVVQRNCGNYFTHDMTSPNIQKHTKNTKITEYNVYYLNFIKTFLNVSQHIINTLSHTLKNNLVIMSDTLFSLFFVFLLFIYLVVHQWM